MKKYEVEKQEVDSMRLRDIVNGKGSVVMDNVRSDTNKEYFMQVNYTSYTFNSLSMIPFRDFPRHRKL